MNVVVDSVLEDVAALLEELCAVSTATGDAEGLRRCARRLGSELVKLGFEVEIEAHRNPEGEPQPVMVASSGSENSGRILLIGHLDTVLPAVEPVRSGNRLEGTGALDMKGGFAAFVGALRLRWAQGKTMPDGLTLIAVPDEEVGGPISEAAVRRWGEGARAVLVLEPGARVGEAETIVTGRRGLSVWRLDARGRAAHSGLAFDQGRSALAAAAEWSARAQDLSEPGGGPVVNVGRIVGGDSEFVQDLGEEHRFVGTSQRLNVVADRCLAEGEARYLTPADRDRILEAMRRLAVEIGDRREVRMDFNVEQEILPAPPTEAGAEIARRLVETAADDGWTLELEADRGGVSFPNFLPDPGSVPVIDGLGPVGDGMHTREEWVSLESLNRRIRLIASVLSMV